MKKIYKIVSMLFVGIALNLLNLNAEVNADSVSVTIYCDLTGTANENASALYITGHFTNPGGSWNYKTMTLEQSKIWKYTIKYLPGSILNDTTAYYFATTNDWNAANAENVPAPCNRSWGIQRSFQFDINKPDSSVAFKWGQCQAYKPSDLIATGINVSTNPKMNISAVSINGDLKVFIPAEFKNTNIELVNLSGVTVQKVKTTKSEATLNVSVLPKGIYILKVSGNQKTVSRKITLN